MASLDGRGARLPQVRRRQPVTGHPLRPSHALPVARCVQVAADKVHLLAHCPRIAPRYQLQTAPDRPSSVAAVAASSRHTALAHGASPAPGAAMHNGWLQVRVHCIATSRRVRFHCIACEGLDSTASSATRRPARVCAGPSRRTVACRSSSPRAADTSAETRSTSTGPGGRSIGGPADQVADQVEYGRRRGAVAGMPGPG